MTDHLTLPEEHAFAGNVHIPHLTTLSVSETQVLRLLNSIDANKSTGPDKIPSKILKMTAILIAKPLTIIFNKSLSVGIFPNLWKTAVVTPIFKNKGSASDFRQYRPISLLSCASKILEKLVFSAIYGHLQTHNLLYDKQSGYRPHHSTELQLTYLTHTIYESLDKGHDVTAVYLDISNYFNQIWHEGLIYKCKHEFAISGPLLSWLESYLSNRTQKVKIDENTHSSTKSLRAGCPQGSVLGPLLALMYLNDLSTRVINHTLIYADDTSLYASYDYTNIDETQRALQKDLDAILDYGKRWAITFNATKTLQQTFSHKRAPRNLQLKFSQHDIPIVQTHKHLGVTLSQNLKFHEHINTIIKKTNIAMSPLYAISKYIPKQVLCEIYSTYIQPFHDYCDIVYHGNLTASDELRLERQLNRIARLITGTPLRTPTDKLRKELGWDSLAQRRETHRLTFYHKLVYSPQNLPEYANELLPQNRTDATNTNLRNATTHTLPPTKTTAFQRSFLPATIKKWNSLPLTFRVEPSLVKFKTLLNNHCCSTPPPKYYFMGSKTGNQLHARLRTGTLPLNSYQYQVQKVHSPSCLCGSPEETSQHFLMHCPLYNEKRQQLFAIVRNILQRDILPINLNTEKILIHGQTLSNEEGRAVANSVQNYIVAALAARGAAGGRAAAQV